MHDPIMSDLARYLRGEDHRQTHERLVERQRKAILDCPIALDEAIGAYIDDPRNDSEWTKALEAAAQGNGEPFAALMKKAVDAAAEYEVTQAEGR